MAPLLYLFCFALVVSFPQSAAAAARARDAFQQTVRPFLDKHCGACHNQREKTAGVDFGAYPDEASALESPGVWKRVQRMLSEGRMPPRERPRPPLQDVRKVHEWIESRLKTVARRSQSNPGRVTTRRLNRAEYNNTIRDLLGVDFRPADDFPADDSGYGFDNNGDVLSLSPVLMEKYLDAAAQIAERAIVAESPIAETLERYLAPRIREDEATSGPNPIAFSPRGSLRVQHFFPRDAKYTLRLRYVDRRNLGTPKPGDPPPPKWETAPLAVSLDGKRLQVFDIPPNEYAKRQREVTLDVDQGEHTIEAKFLIDTTKIIDHRAAEYDEPRRMLFIDHFEIRGPFEPKSPPLKASHRKIFVCGHANWRHRPGCGQRILGDFARRAYRRPVTQSEINALKDLVHLALDNGDSFEQAIQLAVQAMLVSPNFLFRIEDDPDSGEAASAHPVNEFELASRLSYFLWSSMPDERLMERATRLELRQPEVLEQEVIRMMADPRSQALVENFAGQWLELRNLALAAPDPDVFPSFGDDLRSAMRQETELFFETIMREDRSIVDFLDARFTFLNERLARHYGMEGIEGDYFRRINLDGRQRSGMLTQASVLMLSSYPTRTSPVLRGKWLLENILGEPPPPPPPGVPELEETKTASAVTLRQQLEIHRANPACAVCHEKMDALGFGLENYDAIGRWRTHEGALPLDTSGALPGGKSFQGPAELKVLLRSQKDDFARCLTEKMLTYALGRGLERYDRPVVDRIARRLAEEDYRFSRLLLAIVSSDPFQMRRGERGK